MSTHKYIGRICWAALALVLAVTALLLGGEALGIQAASPAAGYETRLFDASRVHTIDIVIDDWEGFLAECENEEYQLCSLVIDGESCKNAAIRAKGNSSLTSVAAYGSDRYSFKVEFDRYDGVSTYHGLDKLNLNNIIQDNTYLKDFLSYRLMDAFGVASPLCSYVYVSVNGEEWGLYLAVEGVEDGFLRRNYGQDAGALYKPDSMDFGGGRGNGRDFDMEDFEGFEGFPADGDSQRPGRPGKPDGGDPGGTPEDFQLPGSPSGGPPEDFDPSALPDGGGLPEGFPGGKGGRSSDDVKLKYIDDDPDSYPNLFDSAKTAVTAGGKARLIQSLKALSGGDVQEAVDLDQVLRYFVVHNYVVNGDSYTGSMVHNYYLYEKDGLLSLIPWDYNLAFGTFQGGDSSGAVNDPIDSPLSVSGDGDRPMADWIFASPEYTDLYHQYFEDFLRTADPAGIIAEARALIAPYVERDPTKFCTLEEFQAGVSALETFCALRTESVSGQLSEAIPATDQGQAGDPNSLVDASSLTLSDLGTMGMGGGPGKAPGGADGNGPALPGQRDGDQDYSSQPASPRPEGLQQ